MPDPFKSAYVRRPELQAGAQTLVGIWQSVVGLAKGPRLAYPGSDFLLVVGSGRSGNTLLRRLLMEHGDIYIPPESYVFGRIASAMLRHRGLSWAQTVDLTLASLEYYPEFADTYEIASLRDLAVSAKGWPKDQRSVGTLLVQTWRWIAASKGVSARWMGDKTPLNTLNLGLMRRLFPEARYIYIQRDPFDVVVSYLEAGIYRDHVEAADRWVLSRQAWTSFRAQLGRDRFGETRYEDLVADHARVVRRLLEDLGIPRRVEGGERGAELGDVDVRHHHANVRNPVTTESVGRGRRSLPEAVRSDLARRLNRMAVDAGYDPL